MTWFYKFGIPNYEIWSLARYDQLEISLFKICEISSKYQSRIPVEVSLGHPGLDFYFVLVKSMAKIYNEFITFFYESWIYKTWIFILFCLFKMYFHLKIKIDYKMQKYTTEEDEQKIKFFKRDKNVLFLVHKTF